MRWAELEVVKCAPVEAAEVELWLAVDADQSVALKLHQTCGFQVVTRAPAFGNNHCENKYRLKQMGRLI